MAVKQLKMGLPSTLGTYRMLMRMLFAPASPVFAFLDRKIEEAPNGADEEVLADETQMFLLLAQIHYHGEIVKI